MTKSPSSLHNPLFIGLVLLLSCNSGANVRVAAAKKTWCVAKPSTDEKTLLDNLNYACTYVNCAAIQKGECCFDPNTLISHASVVMNLYYRAMGANPWNCDFRGSALLSVTDPSYGRCVYG